MRWDNQLAATSEYLQASLIAEVGTNCNHAVQQSCLVQFHIGRWAVCNRATIDWVRGRDQSHAVTTNCTVVGGRGVQDVCAVDFLGLLERFHQAEVRGCELRFVQVIVNGFASDRVAQANFRMLLVVDKTLTSAVVECGLATFGFQLREAQEAHFCGALKRHLGVVLREDFIVLRWDHLVLAFDTTQAWQEKVFDR